jgi:phosphate-selective porin OprO/OprP
MNKTPTGLMAAKRVAVAVATVCATLAAPAFADDDVKVLLDLMLKKGVITQQDYDQFMKDNADKAENKEFKNKRLDDDVTKSVKFMQKRATDGAVKEGGFGLVSADGQHSVNLTGRVHFDTRWNSAQGFVDSSDRDSSSVGDNFELRRARIGLNGNVFKDINYEIVTNTVGSSANLIDTAWVNYGFNKDAQVRVGRFKQPFSLEELTSSNNIDFMERSYANQMGPAKQLGAMIFGEPSKGFNYAASLYQEGFNPTTNQANAGAMAAGRVAVNFAELNGMNDKVLHLGVAATGGKYEVMPTTSGNTEKTADNYTRATVLAFRSENRGLSNAYRAQIGGDQITTIGYNQSANNSVNVDKLLGGLELALASGPYKFQSEYMDGSYDATTARCDYATTSGTCTSLGTATMKVKAKAYYYEFMYNITGESFAGAYKSGAFSGLKPNSNYGAGGTGALQIGVRFSGYDASDTEGNSTYNSSNGTSYADGSSTVKSRQQNSDKGNTITIGLNWYLNPNARIMLNLSETKFDVPVGVLDGTTIGTTQKERVFSVRSQLNF